MIRVEDATARSTGGPAFRIGELHCLRLGASPSASCCGRTTVVSLDLSPGQWSDPPNVKEYIPMKRLLAVFVVSLVAAATLPGQSAAQDRLLFDGKTSKGW